MKTKKKDFPVAVIERRNDGDGTDYDALIKILANEESCYRDDLIKMWTSLEKREVHEHEINVPVYRRLWVDRVIGRIVWAKPRRRMESVAAACMVARWVPVRQPARETGTIAMGDLPNKRSSAAPRHV